MSALVWAAWSPDWSLYDKVSFDGTTKVIHVHSEITALDIRSDLYTSWVDWVSLDQNSKYLPAVRYTGLDAIGGGVFTGDTYFLINGWKLSVNLQKVKVTGVLFSDDYVSAYYTENMVLQYPVTVAAIVNTVSTGAGGTAPTVQEIRTEMDSNSTQLAVINTKVQNIPGDVWNAAASSYITPGTTGDTLSQIEFTGVATGNKITSIKADTVLIKGYTDSIPADVRTELTPELTHIMQIPTTSSGLTPTQETMLLEMFNLLGLDPTKPLTVTNSARTAGTISQTIVTDANQTVVTRI